MAIQNDLRMIDTKEPSTPGETEPTKTDTNTESAPHMMVLKRDGSLEPIDLNKIVTRVQRCAEGLEAVDPMRVALRTISGLVDGSSTVELDHLAVRTSAALISEEPNYSRLAARLLSTIIDEEAARPGITSFSDSIALNTKVGLIGDATAAFVAANAAELDAAIAPERNWNYEFFGIRTVYDRYLLRHPTERKVTENPQYFLMRVACGLATTTAEAIEFYDLISALEYLPSSPTLFNSGTSHPQMSSCYLLDSPEDSLDAIYDRYKDVARLSKHAGGIGLGFSRIRARGSLIKGTNGMSNGIMPFLKTLDSSVAAVNQCFAPDTLVRTRKGVAPISKIEVGDVVLGISGQYREVLVKHVYNVAEDTAPMVGVDIKHSISPTEVTAGHPYRAITGIPFGSTTARSVSQLEKGTVKAEWVDAGDLTRGDFTAQVIPTEIVDAGIDCDTARLLGIMLGDGHISSKSYEHGISVGSAKSATAEFVVGYLEARGIHYWTAERGDLLQIRWATGAGLARDGSTGQYVSEGQSHLPFARDDIYTDEGHKTLGPDFSHLPIDQTVALIGGLLETDGYVSRGTEITFHTSSDHLAQDIRYQMLRLGVPTSGQRRVRQNTGGGTRVDGTKIEFANPSVGYDIRIPAVPRIAELCGAKPITKQNWIEWQGAVWSRVREVSPVATPPFVIDLEVEGDESYQIVDAMVHNGGRRKGAACVYLETWHADVEEFLDLKDNTGDASRRAHNINIANWVPDLFMERVEADDKWSLFDPKVLPELVDLYGDEFRAAYTAAETAGLAHKELPARELYAKMMRTLAQTGNGWMNFKDASNTKCNQTGEPGNVVHLSNLCTEIIEVTSQSETAVCNLGSVNLSRMVRPNADGELHFDFDRLGEVVALALPFLDRVIDINFYPTAESGNSNDRWRPVGMGLMGLQDVFFKLKMAFDSSEARALSAKISEEIYFHALTASATLAEASGPHTSFPETRAANGDLQFDLWGVTPTDPARWDSLKARIAQVGLRNSLMIAIAPTATIASIAGCYECIEPQVSNLFKRETLSGEFLQINAYLVRELQGRGLWNEDVIGAIKRSEGSIAGIDVIPSDIRERFRTTWELPMRSLIDMAADRGAFIDQSQSLNLFMESPNIGKLSSMYLYAWKQGLKTSYYLRSRPATRINQTNTSKQAVAAAPVTATEADEDAVSCSLENPESCDSCQ